MLHVSVTWVDKKTARKCQKLMFFLHILKTAFDLALPQLCTIMLPILGDWLTFGRFGDFFWSNLVSSHGQLYPQHEILQHNFYTWGWPSAQPFQECVNTNWVGIDFPILIDWLPWSEGFSEANASKKTELCNCWGDCFNLEMIEIVFDPTSATPCTCWLSRSSLQTLIHCSQRWLSMQSICSIDGFQSMHKIRDGFQCIIALHCTALACL